MLERVNVGQKHNSVPESKAGMSGYKCSCSNLNRVMRDVFIAKQNSVMVFVIGPVIPSLIEIRLHRWQ